jgi:16S rRNA processing protein RimM
LAGWVRTELLLDEDRVFEAGRKVRLSSGSFERWTEIESFRRQHGRAVVKLKGIDDRSTAEAAVGGELWIQSDELPPPAPGQFYTFDLKGCRVSTAGGRHLGVVVGVLDSGGSDLLQIRRAEGDAGGTSDEELLVPFAAAFLKSVDLEARRIEVDLPEGLIDLNGPWRT